MSTAGAEVKQGIYKQWQDHAVAAWVIGQFPLLHGPSYADVPIFKLRLTEGLQQINSAQFRFLDFRSTPKFMISGGCEGSSGTVQTVREMSEIRALTSSHDESALAMLLEPDNYILRTKQRRPVVDLRHRMLLWSQSGLVDAVVVLPARRKNTAPEKHYRRVHGWISPAQWVSNPENPAAMNIVRRGSQGAFELILLTKHKPPLHTSFLAGTKTLTTKETRKALFTYLLSIVQNPDQYTLPPREISNPMEHAWVLFRVYSQGL